MNLYIKIAVPKDEALVKVNILGLKRQHKHIHQGKIPITENPTTKNICQVRIIALKSVRK